MSWKTVCLVSVSLVCLTVLACCYTFQPDRYFFHTHQIRFGQYILHERLYAVNRMTGHASLIIVDEKDDKKVIVPNE